MCNGFCPSKYNISRVSMGSLPGEVCHYRNSTVKHGKTQAANASVNSSSAHPPPPPRADPRELAFFENELANAPPPGQKGCSNAPG